MRKQIVLALCLALLGAGTGTASANPFGPTQSGGTLFADNSQHTFTYVNLTPEFNSSMNWARVDALGARTDMTQSYVSRDSTTDVVAFDDNYVEEWLGLARCVSQSGTASDRCQQWEIFMNIRKYVGRTQNERTHNAVHEVGHTVGLGHSTQTASPMRTGYLTNITFTTDHDVPHINQKY